MHWLKIIHVSAVVVSGSGLLLRGIAVQANWRVMQQTWTKVLPHIVDTLLLLSAIAMCVQYSWYPIQQGWLTAKVLALVVYIVLGTYAIKRGKTLAQKRLFLLLAMLCFSYIVGVALHHDSRSFLTFLLSSPT